MHGKNHAQAFRGGYLIGLIWGSGTLYWIGWATIPGLVGTLLVFACYFAFYAVIQNILYRKWGSISIWAAPFLWTGIEVLISIGPMAFPWNTFANTQTSNPVFIQYVSITGMYGVTFWVLLMNVLIFFLLKRVPLNLQ